MTKQVDLLQGTLDMLILKAVSLGRLHGYGVLLRIQQISGEQLIVQQLLVEGGAVEGDERSPRAVRAAAGQ